MASNLVQQLMEKLAQEPGMDYASRLLKRNSPRQALDTIETYRDLGQTPPGLTKEDIQLADRAVEGERLRDVLGPVAPIAGTAGVIGYEGIAKPALAALPEAVKSPLRSVPGVGNFIPGPESAPTLDENTMKRIMAYISGTIGGL